VNSATTKTVFAYNLSKASRVTIRVYDWNMDLVKTVIRNEQRPAGSESANGRSTDATTDSWDGTNAAGKRVAVGVYYYRITAQSVEHAFGKVIVAK
jgi:flagellar hook assembly protein FlgD